MKETKNGLARFYHFLNQLQILLDKSSKQKNPALWLYQNNARTPLFMLEGLAKLYTGLHNKKKFSKLKEHFKLLEDIIGSIDYYDSFAKEFAKNKKIPAVIRTYLQAQTREKIQSMNELLIEKKWLGSEDTRVKKIGKKLAGADWLNEKDEINAINEFYGKAIYDITAFTKATKFHFDNVEADLHELRRKLRWLSIYPQALRGCIQLGKPKNAPKHLAKYLTKEIINSPYNKMPDAGDCHNFLLLSQNYFYALSWVIAETGRIKDSGLRIVAIKEALQETSALKDEAAYKKAYQLLGNPQRPAQPALGADKQPTIQQLLDQAETVCKTYFSEHNTAHLVIGTAAI